MKNCHFISQRERNFKKLAAVIFGNPCDSCKFRVLCSDCVSWFIRKRIVTSQIISIWSWSSDTFRVIYLPTMRVIWWRNECSWLCFDYVILRSRYFVTLQTRSFSTDRKLRLLMLKHIRTRRFLSWSWIWVELCSFRFVRNWEFWLIFPSIKTHIRSIIWRSGNFILLCNKLF